jgi:hypothetical protein
MTPLIRFFLFLLFFFFPFRDLHANYDYSKITKSQTQEIIDSLSKSNYRTIEKKFLTDSFLFRQRIYIDLFGIHYCKYFYPNGKLRSEGLCDYRNAKELFMDSGKEWERGALLETSRIGTWNFYGKDGKIGSEYDYSSSKEQVFPQKLNQTAADFVKVRQMAEQFFVSHFGNDFYKEHIRCSNFISWIPAGRKGGKESIFWPMNFESDDYELCTPDLPLKHASGYRMDVKFIFEDTIVCDDEILEFDSLCRLKKIRWNSNMKVFPDFHCVKISYREALDSAIARGFEAPIHFEWNEYGGWWQTPYTKDKNSDSFFQMDICTGEIRVDGSSIKEAMMNMQDFCGNNFKNDCSENGKVLDGWKRVEFRDFEIDVPMDWIRTDIRRSSSLDESILSNGKDSIIVESCNGIRARNMYIDDSYDTKTVEEFTSHFQDNQLQGRKIYLEIVIQNGVNDIDFELSEEKESSCNFSTRTASISSRDYILEVFKTIHFKKCP